jgi:hypothetical protein
MDRFLDRFGVISDTGGAMTAEAYMFGPFRVVGRGGSELTPKGQVRRAILAVLLMSPGRSCTKQYLVDLFWAQSGPTKSCASLRTALSTLKKELAPLGDDVITSDRYHVRLAGRALTVSLGQEAENAQLPFLQDLDVDARGSDGFEEWLRDMRLRHSPSAEDTPEGLAEHLNQIRPMPNPVPLGLRAGSYRHLLVMSLEPRGLRCTNNQTGPPDRGIPEVSYKTPGRVLWLQKSQSAFSV